MSRQTDLRLTLRDQTYCLVLLPKQGKGRTLFLGFQHSSDALAHWERNKAKLTPDLTAATLWHAQGTRCILKLL